MKRALIILSSLSLFSVACAVEPFSSDGIVEGDAGHGAVAGTAGAGSAGAQAVAGSAGKASGGGSAGKSGGSAGKAPAAGTGGSATVGGDAGDAGSSGSPSDSGGAGGGSAGSSSPAGAGGMPSTAPSCSDTQAVRTAALPTRLTIPAWSDAFSADGVCWNLPETTCSYSAEIGVSPVDGSKLRLSLSNIDCDKAVTYGKGTAASCSDPQDCEALAGGSTPMLVIDFSVSPSGNGFVAGSVEKRASDPGPSSSLNCEIMASSLADALFTAGSDFLTGTTFSCPAP